MSSNTASMLLAECFGGILRQGNVVFILAHGQVIERYDEDYPLPSALLNGLTLANRPLHVVVGINTNEQKLVVITTYEPDPLQWVDNFSQRRRT